MGRSIIKDYLYISLNGIPTIFGNHYQNSCVERWYKEWIDNGAKEITIRVQGQEFKFVRAD